MHLENEKYEELIARYLANLISNEELNTLKNWIAQSKANEHFFNQAREIWLASKYVSSKEKFDPQAGFQKLKEHIGKNNDSEESKTKILHRNFKLSFYKIGAAIVIAFLMGFLLHSITNREVNQTTLYQEFYVPLGSKSNLQLPDGTKVILNAGTTLRYAQDYGIKERIVYLTGEGYFEVKKDKKKPFVVKTDHINVKALGTTFNVKAYAKDNTVETILIEGSVEVRNTKESQQINKAVILKPKQKYTYWKKTENSSENIALSKDQRKKAIDKPVNISPAEHHVLDSVDLVPDVSWKDKRWIISREQLDELAVKLERRYDVSIRFEDESLKTFRFTGTLEDESLEQVLKVMSVSSPILYQVNGKTVVFKENKEFLKKYKRLYQPEYNYLN